jgi:hypothetical protein
MDESDQLVELEEVTPRELIESQDLGSLSNPEDDGFSVRVSDAPLATPIEFGSDTPAELKNWTKRFALWSVPHRISIIRVRGSREVMSCGLDVQFDAGKKTCSVVALFPTPRHIVRAQGSLGLFAAGTLSASGKLDPDLVSERTGTPLPKAAGSVKVEGALGMRFSTRVCTPYISAGGVGSRHCEFKFDYESEPLHGKDIECWSVLALSKQVKTVKMNLRYYLVTRELFLSRRYEGSKNDLTVSVGK